MGLDLIKPPECPECDVQLRIFLIGRGDVVKSMIFVLGVCSKCGLLYDTWWSMDTVWLHEKLKPGHVHAMQSETGMTLCTPYDVLKGYKPA